MGLYGATLFLWPCLAGAVVDFSSHLVQVAVVVASAGPAELIGSLLNFGIGGVFLAVLLYDRYVHLPNEQRRHNAALRETRAMFIANLNAQRADFLRAVADLGSRNVQACEAVRDAIAALGQKLGGGDVTRPS